jgi:tetratricopeptide (TPR) repeat protein
MQRILVVVAVIIVIVAAVLVYQYNKNGDEEKLAAERAELDSIAEIEDAQTRIERYEQLLDTEPSVDTRAVASRMILLATMREVDDPSAAISRGREMLDGEPEAKVRGYVYYTLFGHYRTNDMPKAIELCKEVLDSGEEAGWLYNSMAWTLQRRDTLLDLAGELSTEAISNAEDEDDKAGAYDTRGWILYKQGKYAEAIKDLESARDMLSEPDAETVYHLAQAYEKSGRHDDALEAGVELLSKSMNAEIREFTENLYQRKHGSLAGMDQLIKERRLAASWEAPDFTLPDFDGEEHSLSDYRGKVVAINFWSPT